VYEIVALLPALTAACGEVPISALGRERGRHLVRTAGVGLLSVLSGCDYLRMVVDARGSG
jgi:hypothetical protein